MISACSDAELLQRMAGGDRRAFDELYERHAAWPYLRLALPPPTVTLAGCTKRYRSRVAEECTIVLSTYLTDDVAALCDRVVVLDGGRTRFDGRPTELAALAAGTAPTVVDGYLCLLGRDSATAEVAT
jgi:ABC-2 type transport system ATP-binding protein